MKLNEQELCAVTKMAKTMILADGSVDLSELKVLRKELMRLGVPDSNVQSVLEGADALTPTAALFSIAAMDEEKKTLCSGSIRNHLNHRWRCRR